MAVQIIVNGGFETGTLRPGWRKTPGSAQLDGGVTEVMSHSGIHCLELRAMDFVEQSFAGVVARASGPLIFWARAASVFEVGPFHVNVSYHDGTSDPGFPVTPTDRWQKFSIRVDTTRRLKRIQFAVGESGSLFVDDVSLSGSRKLPLPSPASPAKGKPAGKVAKPAARARTARSPRA